MRALVMLLFAFLINSATAYASVPELVEKAFRKDFPEIVNVYWEQRAEVFVAMFQDKEGLKKVFYTPSGNWVETRIRLEMNDLPDGVRRFIQEHYQDAAVTFAGKVLSPNELVYRIESELPDAVVVKLLSETGVLLKEEQIAFSTDLGLSERKKTDLPKLQRSVPILQPKVKGQ